MFPTREARSFAIEDFLVIFQRESLIAIASVQGLVEWNELQESYDIAFQWETLDLRNGNRDSVGRFEDDEVDYRWEWAGFTIAKGNSVRGGHLDKLTIPYWSIVLSLTLLSAYLILGKPRRRAAP